MNRRIAFLDIAVDPAKPGTSVLSDTVWDMADALRKRGHDVHIIGSYSTDRYPVPGVTVHNFAAPPMAYRNIVGTLLLVRSAMLVARRVNPDILHSREYVSPAIFKTSGVKTPFVTTVPGNVYARIASGENQYQRHVTLVYKWAARVSATRCERVIATSHGMRRSWIDTGSPPERTPVIPLGVSSQRFSRRHGAREALRIPEDAVHLLFVGRFSPEKGVLDLLRALATLRSHPAFPTVILNLIGRGDLEEPIRRTIAELRLGDIVKLTSWLPQNDLPLWYSAADALVMPSHNEPFGKVMIEAMSCGTAVIASATEGPSDHLRDGENGLLFPIGDHAALSSKLAMLLGGPGLGRRLGVAAQTYVRHNLSWERITNRLEAEVYEPVLAESRNTVQP